MQNINQQIANVLKLLRQERGWSLDKTALQTGVSKAMLGQIEREESSPTIATLWKIASGFQISFSTFLEPPSFLVKNEPKNFAANTIIEEKIRIATLFPFDKTTSCEMFKIDLLPGCEHQSLPHEPGVIEHILVIEGVVDLFFQEKWHSIRKNEGFRFEANQAHCYRNSSNLTSSFYNIIHYTAAKST